MFSSSHYPEADSPDHPADRTAYLTTSEAAHYLRVSKQFLEIARHRGDGPPSIKLARAVRYGWRRPEHYKKQRPSSGDT